MNLNNISPLHAAAIIAGLRMLQVHLHGHTVHAGDRRFQLLASNDGQFQPANDETIDLLCGEVVRSSAEPVYGYVPDDVRTMAHNVLLHGSCEPTLEQLTNLVHEIPEHHVPEHYEPVVATPREVAPGFVEAELRPEYRHVLDKWPR